MRQEDLYRRVAQVMVKPEDDSSGDMATDATLEGACFREVLLLGFLGTSEGAYSLRDDTGVVPLVPGEMQRTLSKLYRDIILLPAFSILLAPPPPRPLAAGAAGGTAKSGAAKSGGAARGGVGRGGSGCGVGAGRGSGGGGSGGGGVAERLERPQPLICLQCPPPPPEPTSQELYSQPLSAHLDSDGVGVGGGWGVVPRALLHFPAPKPPPGPFNEAHVLVRHTQPNITSAGPSKRVRSCRVDGLMLDTTAGTASSEVHSSESAGAHGSSLSQDPHTIERRAAGGAAPEGLAGGWVEAVVILEGEAAEFFPILEPGGTYLFRGWTVLERSMGTAAMGTGAPVQLQMKGKHAMVRPVGSFVREQGGKDVGAARQAYVDLREGEGSGVGRGGGVAPMMDVLEFLDSCVDGGEGGRVVSLRAMVLCVGVQADWMGAPTKDSTPALLYCLRCLDARDSFSKGRDPAGRVTGHVDVFLDTTVTLVPPGVVAGATVSIRRIRPRIGAKGNVSAIAGKDTLIAVEVPVELGWKPPRVTSVPFGGQGGAAGAWRVGRSARLGDVDPIAKEHGLLELRASITSLRHVSLQSRCRFCLCTRTIRPGALQPRAPLCNALSAARGVAAGGAAECQLELYARAECLVDDSTGRAWLLVEGVDMVLGALLGANAETTAALITCACAYGRVEFQQGVTADTLVLSREVEARREAELEAYRRLAVQVESASQGGSLTSLRILAEHRPQAAPPGPGRVAPHKIGEARVGLVSTLKRRRTVDRAVPRLRCWSIVREDAEKEVQLLLARIKGRLEGRDAGT